MALVATALASAAAELPDPYSGEAAAYLLIRDGTALWGRNPDRALPMASLTKVMTAILVLDADQPLRQIEVSRAAAGETGGRLGLKPGERWVARDLLAASLIASANDACRALADALGGDQRRFVARMNRRAAALGLRHTHFENACGHDAPHHRSSARDLALLSEAALQYGEFKRLVAVREMPIASVDGSRRYDLHTRNALLGRFSGARGVKTGYTSAAGKCLIALAERNGSRVLLVLLGARERWWHAHGLLESAFAQPPARPPL